jgi:tRNA(Ile)-lysidine synthase
VSASEPNPGRAVAESGLIDPGSSGVVLVSGGPDSACLLAGVAATVPAPRILALHVDYRLRPESGEDKAAARALCERFGVELVTVEAGPPEGNVQAWARDIRYRAAEEIRKERGLDWIAAGHTATDVAETVIYRLAASPGRRALAAMAPRSGRVIRPLLDLTREQARAAATGAGLPFVDDRSNEDPAYARARIRNEVLPVLTGINAGAIRNIAATRAELIEEGELLDELADGLLERAAGPDGTLDSGPLAEASPALRRIALRRFAERRLGRTVPFAAGQAEAALRLAAGPEGGTIDLGAGASLAAEAGRLRVDAGDGSPEPPPPTGLDIPGEAEWGKWTVTAQPIEPPFEPEGEENAVIDLGAAGPRLVVRGWRPGDRIQPLGMTGTRKLQDLFTDRRVPRSERRDIPVVETGGRIVWVAGLALAHPFRLRPDTRRAARISATRASRIN